MAPDGGGAPTAPEGRLSKQQVAVRRVDLPLRSIRLILSYAASWDPNDEAVKWFGFVQLLSISRAFFSARPLLFELLVGAQEACKRRVHELEEQFMFIRPSFRGTARGTLKNAVKLLRNVETQSLTKVFRGLRRGGAGAREAMVEAVAVATPGEFYDRLCGWFDRERHRLAAAVTMRNKLYYQLCKLQLHGDGGSLHKALAPVEALHLRAALSLPLHDLDGDFRRRVVTSTAIRPPPPPKFSSQLLEQTRSEMHAAQLNKPPPSHPSPYAYFPPHSNSAAPHPTPHFHRQDELKRQRAVFGGPRAAARP